MNRFTDNLIPLKIVFSFLYFFSITGFIHGENWSNFRGPDGVGISKQNELPLKWSLKENIKWRVDIPGKGTSSPVVHDNRVYVTTQTEDDSMHVLAYQATSGDIVWNKVIGKKRVSSHNLHNMATPTPVTDGRYIWAHFGTGDLACLDYNGNIVWQRDLAEDYGAYTILHGMGNSPMLVSGKLIIACMQTGKSYVMGLDPDSGETLWKKDRNLATKGEAPDSYSSPIIATLNNKKLVVVSGANYLSCYDPISGDEIWRNGGLDVPHPYGRTISGPTFGENRVVTVASGFRNQGFVVALDIDGKGDRTEDGYLWKSKRFSPDCPCPLIYQGKVFLIRDDGMASCIDLQSGKADWQERLFAQNIKVSPVASDGKIYYFSGQGECKVVRASSKFEIIAHNDLEEYQIASPAASMDSLFVRTESKLFRITEK